MTDLVLEGNLKKEYNDIYTNKKRFIQYYKGEQIKEFIYLPDIVYNEWRYWKNCYNRRNRQPIERDTFDKYFQAFKDYWQYNTPETQQVFREMELLSKTLLEEWRIKYTFNEVCVYENADYMSLKNVNNEKKTKYELWEEFKMIWDLDPDDYSEHLLIELKEYIHECDIDYNINYFDEYPRNFWEYRENANYHSYKSYSVLKQYMVCQEWKNYIEKNKN